MNTINTYLDIINILIEKTKDILSKDKFKTIELKFDIPELVIDENELNKKFDIINLENEPNWKFSLKNWN